MRVWLAQWQVQEGQRMRLGGFAIVVACLTACAVEPPTPYPAVWPALGKVSSCEELSGTYKNEALATTLWQSPKLPETSRAYMAYLLIDGTSGSMSAQQAEISAVILDGKNLSFRVVPETALSGSTNSPQGVWTCSPSGEISIQFESRVYSEDSQGRSRIVITLSRADGGTLIVRQDIRIRSVTWGVIPNGFESLNWMMFAAVAGP
jgi:hypothetical protein